MGKRGEGRMEVGRKGGREEWKERRKDMRKGGRREVIQNILKYIHIYPCPTVNTVYFPLYFCPKFVYSCTLSKYVSLYKAPDFDSSLYLCPYTFVPVNLSLIALCSFISVPVHFTPLSLYICPLLSLS